MIKSSFLLLIFAWVAGLLGLILGLVFDPIWFARFGSIVVLFGVMAEYSLLHGELNLLYARLEKIHEDETPDLTPSKWHQKKVLVSHATVILGTLIWGFGDLVIAI